jgi:hypothetical protein
MSPRFSELVVATFLAAVLAVVFTWPIAGRFGSAGRVDSGDGLFSIWNVAWVAHALTDPSADLFDANIFYPADNTLAFSEANVVAGAMAVPVWWLTGNPHAASNWVILCSFALAALAAYVLVIRLTGSRAGGTIAALGFAFCAFIFAHVAHVQLLMSFGLPIVLLAMHRFTARPDWRGAAWLGGAMALAGLACGYYGVFGGLMAGLGVVWFGVANRHWRRWRFWALAAGAVVLAGLIVAPFFLPYLEIREAGFERGLDDARMYSSGWRDYLASAKLVDRWMLPYLGTWLEVSFPGFVVLGLAALATGASVRRSGGRVGGVGRPVIGFYGTLTVLALWASFGPAAGLYTVLHETLPVFALLRAPARFGLVVTLGLSVLAGIGMAHLVRSDAGRRRRWLVPLLIALALIGCSVGLYPVRTAEPVNPVYDRLAVLPRAPVVEFPFFERHEAFRHTAYMVASTYHWQRLVNGYSDHMPPAAYENMEKLPTFPGTEAWQVLSALRVRYVVVHWNVYGGEAGRVRAEVEAQRTSLRPMVDTPDATLYEVVRWVK